MQSGIFVVSHICPSDAVRAVLPAMIVSRAAAGLPPNPHGQQLANVSIILCALAGVLVVARLCVRIFMQRNTGWDDYTLVASLVELFRTCESRILLTIPVLGHWDDYLLQSGFVIFSSGRRPRLISP